MPFDWKAIEVDFEDQLARAGVADHPALRLDRRRIESQARAIATGALSKQSNLVSGRFELAGPEHVESLEGLGARERAELERLGRDAIQRGRVAVAVLNGGMATRFGGDVKGIVEAVGGRTFLEIKLRQARRQGPVPFLIMNSFATHARSLEFLAQRGLARDVDVFLQGVSLRLTARGEPLLDAEGRVSLYAPGHGDFPEALVRSGLSAKLAERGADTIVLSNIDNLGAELDPLMIGLHLARGRGLSAEVAPTQPGDVGGAPAFVDGKLEMLEGFRFPRGFDASRLPFLATNTFTLSRALCEAGQPLTWFYVEKSVDGKTAVQMERLVNELSRFVDTSYVATPRGGPSGRFFPIKTREDLERLRSDPALVRRFSEL
ncbi:MAG TPA: UTP--glucose-1-phosphate uridylyltransferase [Myxococcota bacterium]|nr:UTP--glucose-1-phosphate uridylyltransferase [Myxococcota bacterium]